MISPSKKSDNYKWTVVRHSGFGYGNNPQFIGGLESHDVNTKAAIKKVEAAGGLIFDGYSEAEDFAEFAMYYKSKGLIPTADLYGGFSKKAIDGLQIFIPTTGITEKWNTSNENSI